MTETAAPTIPETLEMIEVLCTSPKVCAMHIATTASVMAGLPALKDALSGATPPALPAAPVAEGWRSMDSAPKNERVIVSDGKIVREACLLSYPNLEGWYYADDPNPAQTPPTHWMPMPPAPGAAPASDRQAEALTEGELRTLMRDPRYWRDRDPAVIAQVTENWNRLYGTATPPGGEGKEALINAVSRRQRERAEYAQRVAANMELCGKNIVSEVGLPTSTSEYLKEGAALIRELAALAAARTKEG